MNKVIRFAILGYGHIGKRHQLAIENNPNAILTAVADTDQSQKPENIPFYDSIDKLLLSPDKPDVLIVSTPNGLHAEHCIKALEAGCHVICEKPMSLHSADSKSMIAAANKAQKSIFCVMQNRYSPPAAWLKSVIEKELIGKLYMVQLNCFWNRDKAYYDQSSWRGTKELDGGVLFTQFSHFIDMLYWLFGDITNIQTRLMNFNHSDSTEFDDSGMVQFEFIKGGSGSMHFSTSVWDRNMESSITIIGEKGSIKVGGQYMERIEYCHIKDYTLPEIKDANPPNNYGTYTGSAANHHYVIENTIAVLNGTQKATTSPEEGLKVVEMIERIYSAEKDH